MTAGLAAHRGGALPREVDGAPCAPPAERDAGVIRVEGEHQQIALPGAAGNLYRFDGWKRFGQCKPWSGGGTWSRPSVADRLGDGVKTLFCYEYPARAPSARVASASRPGDAGLGAAL